MTYQCIHNAKCRRRNRPRGEEKTTNNSTHLVVPEKSRTGARRDLGALETEAPMLDDLFLGYHRLDVCHRRRGPREGIHDAILLV